ncbi:MAG: hypothetical protein QME81_17975 [bacterium]|nr:hypothetical protein [bacterium]
MSAINESTDSALDIDRQVTNFSIFIKELCPEANVVIEPHLYETEDANIFVYPPPDWSDEECYALEDKLSQKSIDILLETGYQVLMAVFGPSDNPIHPEQVRK